MSDVDVVVVGGGLAGLTAAREIQRAGSSALVLEARDRVGGRTYSVDAGSMRVDLGGQWLGPTQKRMAALVAEFGIATFPTFHEGSKVLDAGGKVSTYSGTIPKLSPRKLAALNSAIKRIDKAVERSELQADGADADSQLLDLNNVHDGLYPFGHGPADVRDILATAVRVVFGAEPSEISLPWFLFYARAGGGMMSLIEIEGGAQETRFIAGAQSVALALARDVEVELDAPVSLIEQDPDGVTVTAGPRQVRAKQAVVAVPPALAGRIAFDPPLPHAKDALLQRFPMGATIKIHLLYERAFWRDQGLSGEAVVTGGPIDVVFDNTSHDGAQPALLVFACANNARNLATLNTVESRARVVGALERCFGAEATEAVEYVEKDWSAERWTRGCPTGFLTPGAFASLGPQIRSRFGRIHWAGSETSTEWTGYMEGAVASGERAAAEAVGDL